MNFGALLGEFSVFGVAVKKNKLDPQLGLNLYILMYLPTNFRKLFYIFRISQPDKKQCHHFY